MNSLLLTDGYKLDHRRQYPEGTEYVYSNWTPRSNYYLPEADGAVVFGIQYMLKHIFIDYFNRHFFQKPEDEAVRAFKRRIDTFLGPNEVGDEHVRELHRLGYLPVLVKALPEGDICPIGVPMLTIINTDKRFFWVTNFLETIMSNTLWLPMTSATIARIYKKEWIRHAKKTGFYAPGVLDFLCHDFSMRGMAGLDAAISSGMGHLTSFTGSETIPAIDAVEQYYHVNAEDYLIAGTVPATEHSVMCAGGKEDEYETFHRLITQVYPKGIVSIVSDTWDFWQVITDFVPRLKDEIMARDGRVVIRPDSGDPVKIIAGWTHEETQEYYATHGSMVELPEHVVKGAYECLIETFGYTLTESGYKMMDTHIGMIYGDSITPERQKEIFRRLEAKRICASNLVLGVGSYTYQYKTRDSLGFAMKATWCQVNGEPRPIFKQPKTDDGTKNSLKGLIRVSWDPTQKRYKAFDNVDKEDEEAGLLLTVFKNGNLTNEVSLKEIRERLAAYDE